MQTKKRRARLSAGPAPRDWHQKLDPLFVQVASIYKKAMQHGSRPGTKEERLRNTQLGWDLLRTLRVKESRRFAIESLIRWHCWMKHHKTAEEILESCWREPRAIHQLTETLRFVELWLHERLRPSDFSFKTKVDHSALMIFGVQLGLQELTQEELEDCFDAICPCGAAHSSENLRKLRSAITRKMKGAYQRQRRSRFGKPDWLVDWVITNYSENKP
jgi:hypothetical protein